MLDKQPYGKGYEQNKKKTGKEYFFCTNCRIFPQLAHVGNSAQWVIDCVVVQTDIVMKASPSTADVERSLSTTNAIIQKKLS